MDRARLDAGLATTISALLIGILVTAPLATGALRDQEFFWLQMLGVIAGALWLWRLWLNRETKVFLPPIIWPLLAFCVYAVIRYFSAELEYVARKELVRVLFYLLFFALALNHFRNLKTADLTVGVLLILGMGLSVYALRQYLTGTSAIWNFIRPGYAFRGSGTFIYPNHFAGFAEIVLAIGFGYVFLGSASKWTRIFFAYCSIWIALGIYLSFSRAGWIATLGGLFILLPVLLRNRQRQVTAFVLFVALLGAGLAWELKTHEVTERLHGMGADDPISGFNPRKALWKGAYKMWRADPLWGGGPGHFDERFRAYRTPAFQFRAGHAHCDYLQVLADWGAVGAALLAGALGCYLWPLARHWIRTVLDPASLNTATTNYFALTCGGFAGTLALLAHSFVDYQWYAPGVMLAFAAIVAMLICQIQGERFQCSTRLSVSAFVVPVVIFLAYQAARSFREHYWLDRVNGTPSVEERLRLLERAFTIEPTNFQTAYLLGETYRSMSWDGGENYRELAGKAMEWYDRAAQLNRFDAYPSMRKAMCLDWLKRSAEAEPYIQKAVALDPEDYLVLAIAGWHYFQAGDDSKSFKYLQASHARKWTNNPIVSQYFRLLHERSQAK